MIYVPCVAITSSRTQTAVKVKSDEVESIENFFREKGLEPVAKQTISINREGYFQKADGGIEIKIPQYGDEVEECVLIYSNDTSITDLVQEWVKQNIKKW